MKISEHVYFYPAEIKKRLYGSNTTIIKGRKQIIIDPDTDKENHLLKLRLFMKEDGIFWEDTDEIWITHAHPDHIATVGTLVKELNCRVCCHPLSINIFENPSPTEYFCTQMIREINKINFKMLSQIIGAFPQFSRKKKILKKISIPSAVNTMRILAPFLHLLLGIPSLATIFFERVIKGSYGNLFSAKIHMTFRDGEIVKNGDIDIKTIFCPGHTPDEVAFYIPQEKILITGDLIKIQKNESTGEQLPLIPVFNSPSSDLEEALSSLKKLKELGAEILIPGHRKHIVGEINNHLLQMIEEIEKRKQLVIDFKNRGLTNIEILRYIVRDLSKSYPHCSRLEQIFYSHLLLRHLNLMRH